MDPPPYSLNERLEYIRLKNLKIKEEKELKENEKKYLKFKKKVNYLIDNKLEKEIIKNPNSR